MQITRLKNTVLAIVVLMVVAVFSLPQNAQAIAKSYQDKEEQAPADEKQSPKSIAETVVDYEHHAGFFDYYWDKSTGKIWLKIDRFNDEFLYVHSLSSGLGSNPVGLDRGQLGGQKVVHFNRVGPKVLLTERNLKFRASGDNALEQKSVAESFAQSIIWGFEVAAENPDGSALIDLTPMIMSDMHGVQQTLKRSEQGDFSIDESRSAIFLDRTKSFPDNTEFESALTFTGNEPGSLVRQTTPSPKAITLRQHHSFVRLPDSNYKPRLHDPRCPSISISFADYAAPLDESIQKRWIIRHRLEKADPAADLSTPVEPIVYYVDPGAPAEIQKALIEGASWWNDAFTAAGFKDAFRVEVLPEDADPMDVRYNMIQWVHRATRGWSYGASVIDPRTGEIIKGHVSLGSLRVRQDRILFEGMLPESARNNHDHQSGHMGCACGMSAPPSIEAVVKLAEVAKPVDVALARIRQLSAHEVGHTLGFVHNFAASTYGRASVMDYPAPLIKIDEDGKLDLSDAYAVGIGEWDKVGVRYAYSHFADEEAESAGLKKIIDEYIEKGMLFISDADSRPASAAHPLSNLWDNGSDPVAELKRVMKVRRLALDRFDKTVLDSGRPMSDLEQLLVPVFLHHRFQVDAAAKMIAGSIYTYAVNGDAQTPSYQVPGDDQLAALEALFETLKPSELVISESIVRLIPPRPYSTVDDIERFPGQTGPMFDPYAAAEVAIDLTLNNLLQPQRFARLAARNNTDPTRLNADAAMSKLLTYVWFEAKEAKTRPEQIVSRIVRARLQTILMKLSEDPATSGEARNVALKALEFIKSRHESAASTTSGPRERNFAAQQLAELNRFTNRPHAESKSTPTLKTPPGSPIGSN